MKIRAAVLREMGRASPYARSRPLSVESLDLEAPGPGELLVRVLAAGLCHSDLSVVNGSRPRVMPMVLGHEACGEVVSQAQRAIRRGSPPAGDQCVGRRRGADREQGAA